MNQIVPRKPRLRSRSDLKCGGRPRTLCANPTFGVRIHENINLFGNRAFVVILSAAEASFASRSAVEGPLILVCTLGDCSPAKRQFNRVMPRRI
jgi:hypothetical protein